jgi:hypothetical protein
MFGSSLALIPFLAFSPATVPVQERARLRTEGRFLPAAAPESASEVQEALARALSWLLTHQHDDGR